MSAEPDRRAWSSYGGRWRQVKVRYPKLRPGWGMSPWSALAAACSSGRSPGSSPTCCSSGSIRSTPSTTPTPPAGTSRGRCFGVGLIGVVVTARYASLVVQALNDLFVTRTVEGEVVRQRSWGSDEHITYWVAVDSGTSPAIRAWRVSAERFIEVYQSQVVRAARDTAARVRAVVRTPAGSLEVMAIRFVIIGGGPAGNQAATHAARLGAEVMLVERDVVGGAAHLWDCIPSKAMIATGGAMAFNRRVARHGPAPRPTSPSTSTR